LRLGAEERRDALRELLRRQAFERGEHTLRHGGHVAFVTAVVLRDGGAEPRHVLGDGGLPRLLVAQRGILPRHLLPALQDVGELDDRLLAPQRAVVVEDGDAIGRRHERRTAGRRHSRGEIDDGAFRGAVVPGIELRGHDRPSLTRERETGSPMGAAGPNESSN